MRAKHLWGWIQEHQAEEAVVEAEGEGGASDPEGK